MSAPAVPAPPGMLGRDLVDVGLRRPGLIFAARPFVDRLLA